MVEPSSTKPPKYFWILSGLALAWNLIGVATYLATVTISDAALAAMPEAERALYLLPWWVTSVYAIAVFTGSLGCLALLLRKAWALPAFLISLTAIIIQTGHTLIATDAVAIQGIIAAILPLAILSVAIALVGLSRGAAKRGWIR
jgi:hypothetical protein